jgi:hypothetical protein
MSKKLLLVILPLAIVAFAANDVYWLSDPDAPRIPAAPGAGGGYKVPVDPAGDQPPFGTVLNRWSLTMSGGYAGSGVTWQRDSGKFFLMDQGASGTFRVWKLDPSDPTGTITQVSWNFKDLGSGTVDIPWSLAWDDDSHCFWMSNIVDNSIYGGCYYMRYEWNPSASAWEWRGNTQDSWLVGNGSNGGGLSMLWMAGSEKWIDRVINNKNVFGCAPVSSNSGDANYVDLFDPYTKTDHGRVDYGDAVSERGCALVPWDSAYILTCGWNYQNFVKRDSTGYVLANVSAPTYGPADWAVMVPELVNITDTVYAYCMNNNSSNSFEQVSIGMTWGQLPSVNRNTIRPTQVLSPIGAVDSGQTITPRVTYRNMSDMTADYVDLHFMIDNEADVVIYHDSTYEVNWPAGSSYTIEFTPWVPVGRDSMGCATWCYWEGDSSHRDDTLRRRFLVRVRDVAITAVNEPTPGDTIDPGTVYSQIEIFNYGNLTMTFPVIFNIGPYFDTVWVVNMLAGASRTVTALNSWSATAGTWLCNFSARVAGDLHPENNDTSFVLVVRGDIDHDVACEQIPVPQGVIGTDPFTPQARYANYGTTTETCTTYCWIEDTTTDLVVYWDDSPVTLPPDGNTTVAYQPCTLTVEAPYMVSCSIHLAADQNWLNNAIHQPFRVGAGAEYDVLVSAILAPTSLVDSGAAVLPRAEVFNAGLYPETFEVWFRLPGGYEQMKELTLAPGLYDTVSFAIWRADFPPGNQTAVAFTYLEGDLNTDNDTLVKPFTIQKRDLGVSAIFSPKDTVPDATMVEPSCEVTNYGNTVETFQVTFNIGLFEARETIIGLVGGLSETVVFSDSWMSSPGIWLSRAEVIPNPADPIPGNNVMYDTFWVPGIIGHDVGVLEIKSPKGTMDTAGMLGVEATVKNFGANAETFWTYFSIFDETSARLYYDSVETTSLAVGSNANLTFADVDINIEGSYTARCSTFLATDQNWTNNLATLMFDVSPLTGFPYGWFEVLQMPIQPSGRPVKRGGWAATNEANDLIYVAKGYKTNDFYSYAPAPPNKGGGTWTTLSGMPFQIHPMWGSKPPRKGAKGATDSDNKVYATQGNNSLGWWAYDIAGDTWKYLNDVPLGIGRKKVKGGTDVVYVPGEDTSYVYCLKGYKTEFYRYNVVSGNWEPLDDAPTGARNKWDKGSWLVWDGDRYLYAHKAKYHELYRYDLETQKWDDTTRLTGMPFIGMMGRKKKTKDGGSAAYYDGFIWALKGGNTQEWWKYHAAADTWTEKETMPAFGSTGRKKRVKYGADVVHWGSQALFFTAKGNKTVEFWGYQEEPPSAFSGNPARSGIAGEVTSTDRLSFDVMPNPLVGKVATVRYSLPKAGPVSISIFDVAGRSVSSRTLLASRTGAVNLDLRSLSAGIYLVRLNGDGFEQTRKLVVQQ